MTRFLLLLLAAVALAWLAPARALAEPEIPAERLDLDGVPEIRLDSLRPLKAVPIDGPSGRKGWAVLLVNGKGQGSAMTIPSPAVQDGRVIVGGGVGSRSLWAFDVRNGRKLWRSDLNDNGPSTVAVTPSRTIVNTESCTTYGIDTRTGRRVWAKWGGEQRLGVADDRRRSRSRRAPAPEGPRLRPHLARSPERQDPVAASPRVGPRRGADLGREPGLRHRSGRPPVLLRQPGRPALDARHARRLRPLGRPARRLRGGPFGLG
jgi:hypothetical protein